MKSSPRMGIQFSLLLFIYLFIYFRRVNQVGTMCPIVLSPVHCMNPE